MFIFQYSYKDSEFLACQQNKEIYYLVCHKLQTKEKYRVPIYGFKPQTSGTSIFYHCALENSTVSQAITISVGLCVACVPNNTRISWSDLSKQTSVKPSNSLTHHQILCGSVIKHLGTECIYMYQTNSYFSYSPALMTEWQTPICHATESNLAQQEHKEFLRGSMM